ncbi:COPII coat assembly protein Sec16 [Aspergillus piperis CBS 112811]|uniref:Protein transport protein sec16 n=1 Tax=Aspergillus piperis CBS 112811 TaxID=1448313 RepID=A0A8G1RBX0_9EURO|nr:COPII coat assembly protein Sec16 [Aspergillus piperis CBS 112811]RAH63358.1 COPII coat assembly protein Sec16 [Aspergillus piperis CBS 112811]
MAQSDVAAVWNPALRSDDNATPVPTGPASLEIDTSIEATTIPLGSPMETPHEYSISDIAFPDSDTAAPPQEAASPDMIDTQSLPTPDQRPARNEVPEAPSGDVETTPEISDDHETPGLDAPQTEYAQDNEDVPLDDPKDEVTEAQAVQPQAEESIPTEATVAQDMGVEEQSTTPHAGEQVATEPAHTNGEAQSGHDIWGNTAKEEPAEDDFFNQLKTQTKPIYVPPENNESRFEEGVPLLDDSAESPVEPTAVEESQTDNFFAGDDDEDDGFFKAVQSAPPPDESQPASHITRKSTFQVMDSLGVSLDSPMSEADPAAQEFDNALAAAATGNSIKESSEEEPAAQELDNVLAAAASDNSAEKPSPEEDPAAQELDNVSAAATTNNTVEISAFEEDPAAQEFDNVLAAATTNNNVEISAFDEDPAAQELDNVLAAATTNNNVEISAFEEDPAAQEFDNVLAAAATDKTVKKSSSEEDLAARWQAELAEEEAEVAPSEDDLAARWQMELDDDDDLLLEDDIGGATTEQAPTSQDTNGATAGAAVPGLSSPFGTPQSSVRPSATATAYTPHQPSTSDLLQGIPVPGAAPPANMAASADYFTQPPRPNVTANKAESFAERAKEGYRSPYDLPEDLTRPRRPVASHKPVVTQPGITPPPPRSNSIPVPPPSTSMPPPSLGAQPDGAQSTAKVAAPKNFYEELPLPPPRPQSRPASSGRYTPGANAMPPAPSHPPPPPANPYASLSTAPPAAADAYPQPQVQQPERLDPYASLSAPGAPSGPAPPSATSRYSPKPPTLQAGIKPPSSPRYSPAPPPATAPPPRNRYASQPSAPPSQGVALPFQPRTSSPLAYHEKVSYRPQEQSEQRRSSMEQPAIVPPIEVQSHPTGPAEYSPIQPPEAAHVPEAVNIGASVHQTSQQPMSPPRNQYAPPDYVDEFSKRIAPIANVPPAPVLPSDDPTFVPPRRSLTQSPSQQTLGPRLSVPSMDTLQRPASVHGAGSPTKAVNPYAPAPMSAHNRVASQSLDFIPPTDDQQFDPLERWKGAPIVKFGFGGSVLSCFPKHIPRYSAGQATPKIKSTPGEVKTHQLSDWIPVPDTIARHPGPLKSKSKKKDLLAWLSSKIAAFENEGIPQTVYMHADSQKRSEEKILLWKVVRVLVEHDGVLEGSPEIQKSLRQIIFPHLQDVDSTQPYGNGLPSFSTTQPLDAPSRPDAADPQAVESIRNSLLVGEREKAVWGAVDHRLWGHAMIIASTMDKSVWKQVVQEFVRREVRSASGNTESLAALYEVFAGNVEESVDELVPPSARAGLQMVSKVDGQGASKNALDGLDSWRDTLGLVLSNRSSEDYQALLALGRLLQSYGRTEAAHICFIFSRAAVFGGVDDPQASVVLLGADHQHLSLAALQDEDSILLTEAYEYATSVLSASPKPTLPHLLAFKLVYAWSLADQGRKSEAQQYCDAIAATLKATTKPSPYQHQHLYFGVDELSARLRQTTSDGGSSWISRPSMEKVSGSMWAKFNSFVAGEDNEAGSAGSAKAGDGDIGPFAKIAGTPTVSRSPSVSDIYGSYSAQPSYSSGPSRYQPNNQYAPTSSPEQLRGRSSLDSQRSSSYGFGLAQRRGSQEPSTPVESNMYQGGMLYNSPPAVGYQSTPPQTSYMPLAPVKEDLAPQAHAEAPTGPVEQSYGSGSPYQPAGYGSFDQPFMNQSPSDGGGYMPPGVSSGYEPPAIESHAEPAAAPSEEVNEEEPAKKKSFMDDDDDDDIAARAAAIQKAEKARKDREADEAFRKAAEADAQKPAPAKKSWFGGWFGGAAGGKKEDLNPNKPIRAKLGEENSFYYDKDLKKWVNKKDPNSATAARATPPPPRASGPPSRTASGSSAAPPPPAASASPMMPPPNSRPPSTTGMPPPGSPALSSLGVPPPSIQRSVSTGAAVSTPPSGLAAPPRPATSLSNASSIDDLLGAPTARKGAAAKGKKKGRYVDVMAK